MTKPIKNIDDLSIIPPHGRFGAIRKFDVHTGFDIYCPDGEPVYAIESGIVTSIEHFTGKFTTPIPMPWWANTMAIGIEGKSGVILYGEVYTPKIKVGDKIFEGQKIAKVKRVLKKDKGLPTTMLHIELYEHGYRDEWAIWLEDLEYHQITY